MLFTSDPASGSVTAMAVITSRDMIPRIQRIFCAAEPASATSTDAMSVCTSTVIVTPENVDRPSSPASTMTASSSISAPPYSAE